MRSSSQPTMRPPIPISVIDVDGHACCAPRSSLFATSRPADRWSYLLVTRRAPEKRNVYQVCLGGGWLRDGGICFIHKRTCSNLSFEAHHICRTQFGRWQLGSDRTSGRQYPPENPGTAGGDRQQTGSVGDDR